MICFGPLSPPRKFRCSPFQGCEIPASGGMTAPGSSARGRQVRTMSGRTGGVSYGRRRAVPLGGVRDVQDGEGGALASRDTVRGAGLLQEASLEGGDRGAVGRRAPERTVQPEVGDVPQERHRPGVADGGADAGVARGGASLLEASGRSGGREVDCGRECETAWLGAGVLMGGSTGSPGTGHPTLRRRSTLTIRPAGAAPSSPCRERGPEGSGA